MLRGAFIVALALVSTSCGDRSRGIPIEGVGATGDGSTLLVSINPPDVEGQTCWADVSVTAKPEPEIVRVDVNGRKSHAPDCAPRPPLRLTLPNPLGARIVRDGATGKTASLLPFIVPEVTWLPDGWVMLADSGGAHGWFQQIGVDNSTTSVEVNLFRTGTNSDLRGATITSAANVQGRKAAFVDVRYYSTGPDVLLIMDASWTLMVSSFNEAVSKDTLLQVAEGVTPLPFATTIDAPTIDAPRSGTVSELIDYEGPVNLTGWLTIDPTGHAQLCESLSTDGACKGAAVEIDWETGQATPPTGLLPKGDRQVSDQALTMAGTLKGRVFSVGL